MNATDWTSNTALLAHGRRLVLQSRVVFHEGGTYSEQYRVLVNDGVAMDSMTDYSFASSVLDWYVEYGDLFHEDDHSPMNCYIVEAVAPGGIGSQHSDPILGTGRISGVRRQSSGRDLVCVRIP